MEYKITPLKKSEMQITITVPEEKMHIYRKKACDDISKEINIKGFRKGHVPAHILENYIDKKHIDAHTQEIAMQNTYAEVVIKEKLAVISRPKVKIEKDSPLTFTATVAILPEVKIKDHKSIKIPKKEIKVTEKDIEDVLNDMKKYGTTFKDTDAQAKKGDRVEVDFEGFNEKGEPVPNTKSKNHPVIIGEGSLIPGFEDQLIGMKKDEKKQFDIKFPKDYVKKAFQDKKLNFKVEIKRVQEPIIPELNDEFIEKITGQKRTVADFKKDIEKNIFAKKQEQHQIERENKYIEELLKKTEIEIPDALIDEEAEYMILDIKDDISKKGFEFVKFLEQAKTTEEDLRKKYRPEAEKRVKIRLSLHQLLKEEKIEISDEEIKKEYEKIKSFYPEKEQQNIQNEYDSGKLKPQISNKIALQKLFHKVL